VPSKNAARSCGIRRGCTACSVTIADPVYLYSTGGSLFDYVRKWGNPAKSGANGPGLQVSGGGGVQLGLKTGSQAVDVDHYLYTTS
jgi:hypothetical protein